MRLVTFQDKYVLDLFKLMEGQGSDNPVYECKYITYDKDSIRLLIKKFIIRMKQQLKIPNDRPMLPIWCWVIPKDKEITDEYLDELFNRMTPNCGRVVAMELEVPKEFVLLSNFDVWNEHMFNCVFYDNYTITDNDIEQLFIKVKGATLQASIPILPKSFIKSIKDYNNYIDKDYSATDEEVKELHRQGKFLQG